MASDTIHAQYGDISELSNAELVELRKAVALEVLGQNMAALVKEVRGIAFLAQAGGIKTRQP